MKNKFTLGVIAGMSSLAIAIPVLAQVSSAASGTMSFGGKTRPVPTQENVQKMIENDDAFLTNVDTVVSSAKSIVTAHKSALTAAAAISDDTERGTAVQKANEDERTAFEAVMKANPNFKMPFGGHGGPGGMMRGHGPDMAELATKLGMTDVELKAALDSGKTIEQLATEKGITLPARPMMGMHGGKDMLAKKLGMTADELKAALDSGKTIEQIATEKGVTLPARPAFGGHHWMMDQDNDDDQTSSAQ